MNLLARIDTRGVIVTAPSDDEGYDFVSRFYAPRYGIPEDPVTKRKSRAGRCQRGFFGY